MKAYPLKQDSSNECPLQWVPVYNECPSPMSAHLQLLPISNECPSPLIFYAVSSDRPSIKLYAYIFVILLVNLTTLCNLWNSLNLFFFFAEIYDFAAILQIKFKIKPHLKWKIVRFRLTLHTSIGPSRQADFERANFHRNHISVFHQR